MTDKIHSDTVARELHRLADILDAEASRLDALYPYKTSDGPAIRARSGEVRDMAERIQALDTYLT